MSALNCEGLVKPISITSKLRISIIVAIHKSGGRNYILKWVSCSVNIGRSNWEYQSILAGRIENISQYWPEFIHRRESRTVPLKGSSSVYIEIKKKFDFFSRSYRGLEFCNIWLTFAAFVHMYPILRNCFCKFWWKLW